MRWKPFYIIHRIPLAALLGTKVLKPPLHSLEINCIDKFEFDGRTFLLTGSEDTTLKIFDVGDDFRRRTHVATLTSHISSVRCVDVVVEDQFVLAVSAGGRAQVIDAIDALRMTVLASFMAVIAIFVADSATVKYQLQG